MPVYYSIDAKREVIFFRAEGVVTKKELFATFRALFSDPLFHSDLRFFADMTTMQEGRFSYIDVWGAVSITRFSAKARRAFLLKSDLSDRFYRVLKESVAFHGKGAPREFHDRRKALAWLNQGVPPEKVLT